MKVLNIQCVHQHTFEGWFGSEEDFQQQWAARLIACPVCESTEVVKMLSAPRLNLGATQPPEAAPPTAQAEGNTLPAVTPTPHLPDVLDMPASLQQAWGQLVEHVIAHTEDVGKQFVDEARKIHYGEAPERAIRGQASREEAEALLDEGIAVLALPIPAALKGPLH